jgi:hypothetical protein
MNLRLLIAVFATSASLYAQNILVASSRSNSLEEFTGSGNWIRTFATTGPYAPVALAQSPTTGEIFVTTMWASGPSIGQLTNRILRYQHNGTFPANWDTFTVTCAICPTTATQSLLFDPSGNLWVATAYGEDLGGPIYIFKYLAADLALPNPPAQPGPIIAQMFRGNQMAFNRSGNLCIAGFIDQDVQCFDTSTGKQTVDYFAEIHASSVSPVIQPVGLAFDSENRLYMTSVFGGQLVGEMKPGGPIVLGATLTSSPVELNGNLVIRGVCSSFPCLLTPPEFFTTSFNTAPPTFSTPDPVFKVSGSGTVTKLISETSPPALGNDHIWGGYWMIFSGAPSPILFP